MGATAAPRQTENATVNGERGYLRDITGNRRFWIVKLHQQGQYKSWNFSKYDIDQIWAEAKHYYECGEKLYLEGNVLRMAEEAQINALEADEREALVKGYLDMLLPECWINLNIVDRQRFFKGESIFDGYTGRAEGTIVRTTVCISEIWCECFGKDEADLQPKDSGQIAKMLKRIGWLATNKVRAVAKYAGKHKLYERSN